MTPKLKRPRGYTLPELVLTMALSAILLGLGILALSNGLARARCDTRTMAEFLAEQLRLARQEAISTQSGVKIVFPSNDAHLGHCQSMRVIRGNHIRNIRFDRDYAGGIIFFGYWRIDPTRLEDHTLDNNRDGSGNPANPGAASINPESEETDFSLYFSSTGNLGTNGLTNFNRAYHLLISDGIEYHFAPPPPGESPPPKIPYFSPTKVSRPYTVALYASGLVAVQPGVTDLFSGDVEIVGGPIRTAAPATLTGTVEIPNALTVGNLTYKPKPGENALKLDAQPGADVLLDEGAPLSLQVDAEDPAASWLSVSWQVSPGGTTQTLMMDRRGSEWRATIPWQAPVSQAPEPPATPTPEKAPEGQGASSTPTPAHGASQAIRMSSYTMEIQLADDLGNQAKTNPQLISVRAAGRIFFYSEYKGEGCAMATDPSGTWTRPIARGVAGYLGSVGAPAVDYDTLAPSPDGERLAYRGTDGMVYICNREGLGVRPLTNTSGKYRDLVWSPDGCRLAYTAEDAGGSKIWLASADGSVSRQLVTGSQPRWSPDGQGLSLVAEGSGGPVLKYQQLDPSADPLGEPVLISGPGPIHNLGWVGDRAFYTQTNAGQTTPYLLSGGPKVKPETWGVTATAGCCLEGKVAYIDDAHHNLYCLTPETKTAVLLSEAECKSPCWSPSGRYLLFCSRVGSSFGLCRVDADGKNFLAVTHPTRDQVFPHWVK